MAVRIRYNRAAFKQVRHAAADHVLDRASEILRTLPPGYKLVVQRDPSTQRPRVYIVPDTFEALQDDAENNTLLKAISAARGT